MENILVYLQNWNILIPLIRTLIVIVILLIIYKIILSNVKKRLLKRAKNKKQKSNVEIFSKVMNVFFILILAVFVVLSFAGSLTSLGLGLGLVSAALGWALQTPITGFAAWIMIIVKRPFDIGDRIIVNNMKGDVIDITTTHIYLKEVGGLIPDSEDYSGRMIMVPNSLLFTENIINYTMDDDFILGQVILSIPYENNLDKAIKIALDTTKKYTKEWEGYTKEPYVRLSFEASSVDIKARFHAPAQSIQKICTLITEEIFKKVSKTKDVEVAYPHTEIIYKKK